MQPEQPDRTPLVRYVDLIGGGRPPRRADRAAGGTLPTRAFRACEPATTAAALGHYVFPPMDFMLCWDGDQVAWAYDGAPGWLPLGSAQYPGLRERFDAAAPDPVRGHAPPFLAALPEPGVVKVWTGLLARTRPGWSLLLRAPANVPRAGSYDLYEGLVETDRWFGPLFVNLRLTRTDVAVRIAADRPLFQAQPLRRDTYADAVLDSLEVRGLDGLAAEDWACYAEVVAPAAGPGCPRGRYAAAVRRRRHEDRPRCPRAVATAA